MKKTILTLAAALSVTTGCILNEQTEPTQFGDGQRIALQIEPGTETKAEVDGIMGKTFWNTRAPYDSVLVVTNELDVNGEPIHYKAAVKDVRDGTGYITLSRKGSGSEPVSSWWIIYPDDFVEFPVSGIPAMTGLRTEYRLEEISGMTSRVILKADLSGYPASKTIPMRHLCGLLRLTLKGIPAGTHILQLNSLDGWIAGSNIALEGTAGSQYITLSAGSDNGKSKTVSVTMPDSYAGGSETLNIPLPHGSFSSFEITALDADGAILASTSAADLDWEIVRREGKKLTLDMADGMDGLIWDLPAVTAAEFSVSPSNKVRFTTSNLMYAGKTARAMGQSTRWRLMKYPWSTVEDIDWDTTQASGLGDISLFGWATSGYNGKNPWTHSINDADYGPVTPGEIASDYDWGRYNRIYASDGVTELSDLRLLSSDEWDYLLFNSSRAQRFAYATVCKVPGLLLFPDGWSATGINNVNDKSVQMDYTANILSKNEFLRLAAAGAVFLPAAGCREEELYADTQSGNYWTSTCKSNSTANVPMSLLFDILEETTDPASPIYADGLVHLDEAEPIDGFSVRLVFDPDPNN